MLEPEYAGNPSTEGWSGNLASVIEGGRPSKELMSIFLCLLITTCPKHSFRAVVPLPRLVRRWVLKCLTGYNSQLAVEMPH